MNNPLGLLDDCMPRLWQTLIFTGTKGRRKGAFGLGRRIYGNMSKISPFQGLHFLFVVDTPTTLRPELGLATTMSMHCDPINHDMHGTEYALAGFAR